MTTAAPTRLERLLDLRNQGLTLQAIGDEFGLTRERVRQILKEQGLRAMTHEERLDIAVKDWKATGRARRAEDVAEAYGFALSQSNLTYLRKAAPELTLPSVRPTRAQWTQEEVVFAVRAAAIRNGINPNTGWLTIKGYDAIRTSDEPSTATITSNFLWSAILYGAGFSRLNAPTRKGRPDGSRPLQFTDADLDAAVLDFLAHGRVLSARAMEDFFSQHPEHPSMATIRNRFRRRGIGTISGIVTDVQTRCP